MSLFFFGRLGAGIFYAFTVAAIVIYARQTGRYWALFHAPAPLYMAYIFILYAHCTYYHQSTVDLQPHWDLGNLIMALTLFGIVVGHINRARIVRGG